MQEAFGDRCVRACVTRGAVTQERSLMSACLCDTWSDDSGEESDEDCLCTCLCDT
jgi:hypothetical protein